MKITVKTLKGQMMEIDVELNTTMTQLKTKIHALKGFQIEGQKIVYKGKATQNQDTIEKLNIKDKDFLVVMATIKKPEPKKQQKKVQEKTQSKQQQKPETQNEVKPQTKPQKKQQDPEFEHKVNELMSMGFPRQKCVQTLRAAFGNSQVAIEYILNGIPSELGASNQGSSSSHNHLSSILGGPQFEELRSVLRNDPTAIAPLLQQLAQTQPQLYNLISQHPEQFQRMIIQGGEEGQGDYIQGQESMQPQGEEGAIVVSQAEQQAIERLAVLGFSKVQAAQAYLACDKNQQMAANLLFDRLANGDIDQGGFQQYQEEGDDDDNLFN